MARQYQALAQALHEAAQRHQTVAMSGLLGQSAPIPAWVAQAAGSGKAVVKLSAQAGIAVAAAQDVAVTAGENVHLASGADMNLSAGGAARLHAGQAIGLLGGAMQPGSEAAGTGMTLVAGAGDVEMQAQDGTLQMAAMKDVTFQTVHGPIDFAAAKRIVIATTGGAAVVLEKGNVEFIAPGKFTVRAGKRSFVGGANYNYVMPLMPHGTLDFNMQRPRSV
jgi:uncharacterized protein (DUF2345 family)